MMTLEEAIKHYEKLAEAGERDAQRWVTDGWQSSFKSLTPEREAQYLSERKRLYNQCLKCAKEHRQLAEWLRELQKWRALRDSINMLCDVDCEYPQYRERKTMCKACSIGTVKEYFELIFDEEVDTDATKN